MELERCYFQVEVNTFAASDALEASKARFSNVRSKRRPSVLAKTLIPFSLAEMANRVPSLLKRIRGLALDLSKAKIKGQFGDIILKQA